LTNVSTSSPITYTPRIHLLEARSFLLPAHPFSATQSPYLYRRWHSALRYAPHSGSIQAHFCRGKSWK